MADAPAPVVSTPAPAPVANEAVINQNPVDSQNPVGSQAPDKPAEARKSPAETRRESIQKAFNRANAGDTDDKPAARAKPGIGHNKPPEETPKEAKAPPVQGRERGEGGRFAPRQADPNAKAPGKYTEANQATEFSDFNKPRPDGRRGPDPLPEGTPYRDPHPRMSEQAKADWAATPETVRGDIHRMSAEFDGAYRRYRGDHDTMNSIRHFHDMATQHGTTLDKALTNYVGMEQKLRTDVVGGLDMIVSNLGLQRSDGGRVTLRDIAYHVLSQSPEQLKQIQQGNAQQAAGHQIGSLHQKIEGLEKTLQAMHYEQQFKGTRSAVDLFADDHPRFDELGDLIEQELQYGFDLPTAYARAELLRPASAHAAQTRGNSTPAQTRPADKSISGAPDTPSNGAARTKSKPVGRREAIQNAIRRVNGGLA